MPERSEELYNELAIVPGRILRGAEGARGGRAGGSTRERSGIHTRTRLRSRNLLLFVRV